MSVLRGMRFFLGQLPSYTVIGYHMRARRWKKINPDFKGQTWLVTGASEGIGASIAEVAARNGARVIAVGRSEQKLRNLKSRVQAASNNCPEGARNNGLIISAKADLSQMNEISDLSARLGKKAKIDVLINNVGILKGAYHETKEGLEQSYAVNLLGQYFLTETLLEGGVFAKAPLIIAIASGGLYHQPLNLGLLNQPREKFDGPLAYASHKRAQIALVDHWRRQHRDKNIFSYVMHPGWVRTPGVARSMPMFSILLNPLLRSPYQATDTAIWLAQKRPTTKENIVWFDRKQRPSHIFGFTRRPRTTTSEIISFMDRHIAQIMR